MNFPELHRSWHKFLARFSVLFLAPGFSRWVGLFQKAEIARFSAASRPASAHPRGQKHSAFRIAHSAFPPAFTLIELLFVVAIIAILAAISVPNFLEAQTRSKLARTQTEMALLRAGIRAYSADYDAYPPHRPDTLTLLKEFRGPGPTIPASPRSKSLEGTEYPFLRTTGWDLTRLTTPIAWISSVLPIDSFQPGRSQYSNNPEGRNPDPFVYLNLREVFQDDKSTTASRQRAGYMLLSFGPDIKLDVTNPARGPFTPYDPTNGTTSSGDLISQGW